MKYYKPTFSEFHEGFEFEVPMYGSDLYSKEIFTINTIRYIFSRDSDGDYFMPDIFRVKLLDREDIESLGWTIVASSGDFTEFSLNSENKYNHILSIDIGYKVGPSENNHIRVSNNKGCVFNGTIKNKSELRKLMTQLNIE
jgi:hypothetical protein